VQVGITVVSATAAAFGGASLAVRLSPAVAQIGPLAQWADPIALGLVVALVSFLSIVLGELIPKSIAMRSPEPIALAAGRPLLALSAFARPVVWLLTATSNLFLRPFGDRTNFTESRLSPEELEQLVEEAGKTGELDQSTAEIATRALAFRDLSASDVMVPRNRIVALPLDAPQEELRRVLLEEGRSRMPVFEETLDQIVGYVMAKDFAAIAWEQELILLPDLLRPVLFVPETARAVQVLREMQKRRTQLAIAVDEHGGVAGLITLEDLVEELVGEVFSEWEQPEPLVKRDAAGGAVVRGDMPIRDVNRELSLDLAEGDDYTTIAGLVIALAGAVPERGAKVDAGNGVTLEVVEATPRAVRAVRIHLAPPPPPTDEPR
jgi:putative hemolysin